jgi:hypothetical protein
MNNADEKRADSTTPCPACDLEQRYDGKLTCFAVGVALGAAFAGDMHAVTELMCGKHRTPYIMAACRAAVAVNETSGVATAFSLELPRRSATK